MTQDYVVFEKVVASIFKQLSRDCVVKHNDKINGRQIDVSIRTQISGIELLVIVQCKKFKNRLDVTYVDELLGTMQDIGAHRGVLVTTKGFSAKAMSRAAKCGIDLCIVKDAENRDWKIDLKIPVVYDRIHPIIAYSYEVNLKAGDRMPTMASAVIAGINPWTRFKKDWEKGELSLEPGKHIYKFNVDQPKLKLANGEEREVRKLQVVYTISRHLGFGYLDEIPKTKIMNNITTKRTHIIIDEEEFIKYKKNFITIKSRADIPIKNAQCIMVLDKPELDKEMHGIDLFRKIT